MTKRLPMIETTVGVPLVLPFLGDRVYLQGTTLFDALAPLAPPGSPVSLNINRMIYSDTIRIETMSGGETAERFSATFTVGKGDDAVRWGIDALEASPDIERVAFDEESLLTACDFSADGAATLPRCGSSTFMQSAVSMMKRLIVLNGAGGSGSKWIFVRTDLKEIPFELEPLTITLKSIAQNRIARSSVVIGDKPMGFIFFTLFKE